MLNSRRLLFCRPNDRVRASHGAFTWYSGDTMHVPVNSGARSANDSVACTVRTAGGTESVWQPSSFVRARLQPCRKCSQINKASAAEGLAFECSHRLGTPLPRFFLSVHSKGP